MSATPSRRSILSAGAAGAAALAAGGRAWARPGGDGARAGDSGRPTRPERRPSGAELFSVVAGWSQWDLHRTGYPDEAEALRWVERQVAHTGARVGRWHYEYPFYEWSSKVTIAGRRVPSVPLYYEGVGSVRTRSPYVEPVHAGAAGENATVQDAVDAARAADAELAVLPVTKPATAAEAAYDGLVAFNSDPDTIAERTGVRTLFVPGRVADAAAEHGVHARFDARVRERRAYNVTGWLGTRRAVRDPIVVTTPLSGWFTCAGERGTGVAIAYALAHELAKTHPVFFLGNTGHELDNYGVRQYLANEFDLEPRAVVHLGASLGAGAPDARGRLSLVTRSAAVNPGFDDVPGLAKDLADGNFAPVGAFPGEGAEWSERLGDGVPLLSLAGQFRFFHTPDDRPRAVTTPALLSQAYSAIRAGVRDLLAAT